MRLVTILTIWLVTSLTAVQAITSQGSSDIALLAGIPVEGINGKGEVDPSARTASLPVQGSKVMFAVSIRHTGSGPHTAQLVVHYPSAGKVTGTLNYHTPVEVTGDETGRVFRSDPVPYDSELFGTFSLESNDPVGEYIMEVLVDGKVINRKAFEVTPATDAAIAREALKRGTKVPIK